MRCEARTLDDIRALGGNDAADERRFATAARVSEINLALYRTFAQPVVRAMVNCAAGGMDAAAAPSAAAIRVVLRREPDDGAGRRPRGAGSQESQARRRATIRSWRCRKTCRGRSSAALDAWRDASEAMAERTFLAVYGLPALQAAVGIDPSRTRPLRKAAKTRCTRSSCRTRIAELKSRIPEGGLREAVDPRAALCGHEPRRRRRARVRTRAPDSRGARRAVLYRSSRRWCASNSTCC